MVQDTPNPLNPLRNHNTGAGELLPHHIEFIGRRPAAGLARRLRRPVPTENPVRSQVN